MNQPEATDYFAFDPVRDIAQAVAREISAARIFSTVSQGSMAGGADYLLRGAVESTEYSTVVPTYGLSVAGLLLPLAGFPLEIVGNDLVVSVYVTRRGSDGVVWQHTINASLNRVQWLYRRKDRLGYDELLRSEIPCLIQSLRTTIVAND